MLGFTPISALPFGEFYQRAYISVDDITVTFSVDAVDVGLVHNLGIGDLSVGINVPDTDIAIIYNFNNNNVSVPINVGDVRFTWDLQEDVAEAWTQLARFPTTSTGAPVIQGAILDAALMRDDEAIALFRTAEAIPGRELADITNNGDVRSSDAVQMFDYINGDLSNVAYKEYIENYMLPYMAERQDQYKRFYNINFDAPTWLSISTQTENWTNVA